MKKTKKKSFIQQNYIHTLHVYCFFECWWWTFSFSFLHLHCAISFSNPNDSFSNRMVAINLLIWFLFKLLIDFCSLFSKKATITTTKNTHRILIFFWSSKAKSKFHHMVVVAVERFRPKEKNRSISIFGRHPNSFSFLFVSCIDWFHHWSIIIIQSIQFDLNFFIDWSWIETNQTNKPNAAHQIIVFLKKKKTIFNLTIMKLVCLIDWLIGECQFFNFFNYWKFNWFWWTNVPIVQQKRIQMMNNSGSNQFKL